MYKIAAVGDRESILAFKAFGMYTVPADTREEATEAIRSLAAKEVAIILLTEQLAVQIPDLLDFYAKQSTPAIILIPGGKGSLGIGMAAISQAVEKAVGADIFGNTAEKEETSSDVERVEISG